MNNSKLYIHKIYSIDNLIIFNYYLYSVLSLTLNLIYINNEALSVFYLIKLNRINFNEFILNAMISHLFDLKNVL